ncbi:MULTISPECIES: NAD(P)-dependent oxidoreductase [Nocardiaceae]|uniref:NAD(P)-dependent dehydrogenase (Short-subunit alcohol dehydrogenase family) n=1 Tax=Rhodococcoides corynebacterioides TaxID=53972 RepID=A0ABS2KMW3_9NOCA|nr:MULTISPECIES: NAD(P)-dependent oxidoreductase [Rhodococcus]MBM7413287.1 NAD(P)-dependent dehydrogenase (short-subunit alcohol dehydrogenase family) [Rhodococcus corynebacterioides]MBP1115750.1 NAD(P)-dependent dehydrogenase (short-subunit alcohol dehydrogenase family) [Rhodococcus sp. PvP016]
MTTNSFAGRTAVMSGGSRGIGLAIALEIGRRGGNLVLLAKTDTPDPRLPGTVHTAVDEIVAAGGHAVAVVGDVRNEEDIQRAATTAVETFGGIDIVVNNASVLNLSRTTELPLKRFDLMQQVNVRGTFALTQACLPHLVESENPHVLTLSPPLNMSREWLGKHPGYMLAKYGMTLAALGIAAEYADEQISCNCLWPESTIATAAVENLLGGKEGVAHSRSPQIMADAAVAVLGRKKGELSGQTLIDVDVLAEAGVSELSIYGGIEPISLDIFVDPR